MIETIHIIICSIKYIRFDDKHIVIISIREDLYATYINFKQSDDK